MSAGVKPVERAVRALQSLSLAGLSPRPVDMLPLLRMGGLRWLWSCEGADIGWTTRFDVELLSVEEALGARKAWRSVDVDALLPLVTPYLSAMPNEQVSIGLVPYSLTSRWRAALADAHRVNVPPGLAPWPLPELTDKIKMRRWLRELQVPLPRYLAVRRTEVRYAHLVLRLGSHFVLQTPNGSAGVGTSLIENTSDVEHALMEHPQVQTWLASSYVGDRTLNIHGLVSRTGEVTVSRPSIQVSNLAAAGSAFGVYSGSDFQAPLALPPEVLDRCRAIVHTIGQALAARRYQGIFGVDLAVDSQCVAVLEVNGRMQASTWLLGEIELENGEVPMLARHVMGAQGYRLPHRQLVAADGAQLVVRHTGRAPMSVVARPQPGIYGGRGRHLAWRRPGIGLMDCGPGEMAICDLPQPGAVVQAGAVLARLVTRHSLTAPTGQSLTPDGAAALAAFRAAVSLTPCVSTRSLSGGR